jgi:hypothetical protein
MKTHRIEPCALLFVLAFFPAASQAQNAFRLYAGAAPTSYKITFDQNAPNFAGGANYKDKTAKSTYTAVNVGLTWVSPKAIYVDFAAQQSLSATHDLWKSVTSQDQDFSHDSYTLTAGYSHVFDKGISVSGFGGYTVSNTVLNAPRQLGFTKDKFDSHGIFVGVGAGIPALGGQFSGSVALAGMSGKWKDDVAYSNSADYTVGFSLGAAYTYKISQAWGVGADIRLQQYKYTFGTYTTQPAYSVKENISSLGVKAGYQF